jgi:hypothetical protein
MGTQVSACASCAFWNPLGYEKPTRTSYNEPVEPGEWGYCALISADTSFEDDDPADDARSPKAFTRDGSDFWSALLTRSDFGCVEWRSPYNLTPKETT